MYVLSVHTTLKDKDGESYVLGPYRFSSEAERSAWEDEFCGQAAELYCELRGVLAGLEPLLLHFEPDVPVMLAGPPPPPEHLVRAIRGLFWAGELNLRTSLAAA